MFMFLTEATQKATNLHNFPFDAIFAGKALTDKLNNRYMNE